MEHAWKVCVPQGTEGSNPSLSATFIYLDTTVNHTYLLPNLISLQALTSLFYHYLSKYRSNHLRFGLVIEYVRLNHLVTVLHR